MKNNWWYHVKGWLIIWLLFFVKCVVNYIKVKIVMFITMFITVKLILKDELLPYQTISVVALGIGVYMAYNTKYKYDGEYHKIWNKKARMLFDYDEHEKK